MKKLAIPVLVLLVVVGGLYLATREDPVSPRSLPESGAGAETTATGSPAAVPALPGDGSTASGTASSTLVDSPVTEATDPGKGTLAGRVVDVDGVAIEGAVIHLVMDRSPREGMWMVGETPALDDEQGRTVTDAAGAFHYEGLDLALRFSLFARAEGWIGERMRQVEPGAPVEFILEVGEVVRGVVLDPRGRKIPEAAVRAGPTMTRLGEGVFLPVGMRFDQDTLMPVTVTGPDGTFILTGIPRGEFSLAATHPQWGPSEVVNLMQGQEGLTLELRPNTVVEGRVFDPEGRPVAGARVRSLNFGMIGSGGEDSKMSETDAQGNFRLEGLAAGTQRLLADAEGFPSRGTPEPISLEEGEVLTGVEIILERGASIRGVVMTPDGLPLEGAAVSIRGRQMGPGRGMGAQHRTEADGSFKIEGIAPAGPDGMRRITIEHPKFSEYESEQFALGAGAEVDLGTIVLGEAVMITGRVTDLDGRAISGAAVSLVEGGESRGVRGMMVEMVAFEGSAPMVIHSSAHGSTSTDLNGEYRLKVEEPGEYSVSARASAHQRIESAPLVVADRSIAGIDLALPPALQISGRVTDELGVSCAEVTVRASREGGRSETADTDADGNFSIDGLDDASYRLTIQSEGWSLAGDPLEAEGGSHDVVLVARRPGSVAGTIIDAVSGNPITQFSMQTRPDFSSSGGGHFRIGGMGFGGVEYRDPEGRFLLESIAPGAHRITVNAPNMVEQVAVVEVASGRTTDTVIQLERAGSISGRVVDSAGSPVAGVTVTTVKLAEDGKEEAPPQEMGFGRVALSFVAEVDGMGDGATFNIVGGPGKQPTRTDENGDFLVEGIADGDVKVKFAHDEYRSASKSPVTVRRGAEQNIGSITIIRGATLQGIARAANGAKLMWSTIRVIPTGGGEEKSSSPDSEGVFTVGGLDAGSYQVKVSYMIEPSGDLDEEEFRARNHDAGTIQLRADEERTLDLVLPVTPN